MRKRLNKKVVLEKLEKLLFKANFEYDGKESIWDDETGLYNDAYEKTDITINPVKVLDYLKKVKKLNTDILTTKMEYGCILKEKRTEKFYNRLYIPSYFTGSLLVKGIEPVFYYLKFDAVTRYRLVILSGTGSLSAL